MNLNSFLIKQVAAVVLIGAAFGSSGCVQLTQSEIKALETREMDCSFDEAYKAASHGLFSLGFTISHSDKESGILTGTRHDPNTGAKVANTILFGVLGLALTKERNEALTFMLTPLEPNLTQLRMKVIVNGKAVVDRKFMTAVWQQIEREAMLESRPSERSTTTQPTAEATARRTGGPVVVNPGERLLQTPILG